MTGQPAARVTDKVAYGAIVTGSLTVHIGSQGGIACSVCPGGVKVANPVNPQLGAKVLLGEEDLDFALPGALPLIWQRQYSSYVNAEHGAQCGPLGYGWKLGQQIQVELRDEACLLFDAAGDRTIRLRWQRLAARRVATPLTHTHGQHRAPTRGIGPHPVRLRPFDPRCRGQNGRSLWAAPPDAAAHPVTDRAASVPSRAASVLVVPIEHHHHDVRAHDHELRNLDQQIVPVEPRERRGHRRVRVLGDHR